MKLKDVKIGTQLCLGLGLILAFVLLLGGLAWKQTDLLWLQTKGMYDHPLTVRRALGAVEADVLIIYREMKDLCLAESDQEFATHLQHIDKAKADAFTQLNILHDRYLGAPGDITNLHDEFVKWNAIREETIRLLRGGKRKEAEARTKSGGVGGAQAEALTGHILKIDNFARNKGDQFYRDAEEMNHALNRHLAVIVAIILLLSLIISYALLKGVKEPLDQLTATADQFGQGKMDARSPYVSSNEFGALSAAFNAMADRLQSLFWLKDGLAALNSELSGDLPADQIAARGLNFISRYVEACAGAFYAYDQSGARWELKAPYALGEGTCLAPQFKAGEGIVGQVAAERKPIFLEGITRDQAVALSGTVSAPPRQPLRLSPVLSGGIDRRHGGGLVCRP